VLAEELEEAGARVEQIVVCTSIDVDAPSRDVARALSAGQIDWITVTSSAAGQLLARLYGDNLRMARLASISPLTSTALRDLGYEPAAEASEGTTAGLLDAILCAGPSRAGQRDG
jgi:uroporphyrinogen III methyltransferase/synthase